MLLTKPVPHSIENDKYIPGRRMEIELLRVDNFKQHNFLVRTCRTFSKLVNIIKLYKEFFRIQTSADINITYLQADYIYPLFEMSIFFYNLK